MSEPNIDDSVVVTNYTFLHFVVWFLSPRYVKKYFALENRVAIEMNLKKFISSMINLSKMDAHHVFIWYNALSIYTAHERSDQLILNLFKDVISSCGKIRHLMVNSILLNTLIPLEDYLDLMEPYCPSFFPSSSSTTIRQPTWD